MLRIKKNNRLGQNLLEYTIVIGLVTAVLAAMGTYIQRGIQGMIRTVADQVGTQENAEQVFNTDVGGFIVSAYTDTDLFTQKETFDTITPSGNAVINYVYDDTIRTSSDQLIDQGFTEDPPP